MPADDSHREEMIHTFAQQNRLPISRETDRTTVIAGRVGCHLYEYSDSELGLMVLSDAKDSRPRRWAGIRKKCLEAGMTLRQNGEDEGALSFAPNNRQQAHLAIKIAGARPKRQLSPEHRAKLLAVGFQKRETRTLAATALLLHGDRDRCLEWLGRALAIDPEETTILYNAACTYSLLGEKDQALDLLEKAVRNGYGHKEWLENDPDFASLRDHPRFQALMQRLSGATAKSTL